MKNFHLYVVLFIFIPKIYTEGDFSETSDATAATTIAAIANSSAQSEVKRNLNVILFVTSVPKNYTFKSKLKDVWNFDVAKTIQPCVTKRRSIKFNRISRIKKTNCECDILLKQHLLTLMDWARESIGMLTAVVSLTENGYSDAISSETNKNGQHYGFNYFNFKLNNADQNSTAERDDFIEFPLRQEKDTENRDDDDDGPDLVESEENREDSIPIINAFPRPIKFNKNFRSRRYFWSPNQLNGVKNSIKLMKYDTNQETTTQTPETSSSTKVDLGDNHDNISENAQTREAEEETRNNFVDTTEGASKDFKMESPASETEMDQDMTKKEEVLKEPKNVEDLSNIMTSIKKQIFHNIIEEPTLGDHQEGFRQPKLKELVEVTFNQTVGIKRGYLLLFMGSNISELETPDSDLGQSLQYLIDNAKESNTVIIVSGGCTDKAKEVETEDMDTINKGNVPFFALGPDAESDYSSVDDLCKVTDIIKVSINRHHVAERKIDKDEEL